MASVCWVSAHDYAVHWSKKHRRPIKRIQRSGMKPVAFKRQHPCGHDCYPGREPQDWCIECKYGDKPYH